MSLEFKRMKQEENIPDTIVLVSLMTESLEAGKSLLLKKLHSLK